MIAEVNFLTQEEAFFHGNGKISNSLDFFLAFVLINCDTKLRHP
jgi:hypothetical protein